MIQGYLIEKYTNMAGAYTTSRYLHEAPGQGINLKIIGARDLLVEPRGRCIFQGQALDRVEVVMNRYKQGHLAMNPAHLGKKEYNTIEGIQTFGDKFHQLTHLNKKKADIQIPKSILAYCDHSYEALAEQLGQQFVIKGLRSSQGKEVELIESKEAYESYHEHHLAAGQELLFQKFIPETRGRDLRVFVIKGQVISVMLRESTASFKANFALGAKVSLYPIDEEIKRIARRVYEQTDLFYFGLDLLFGEQGYYFCELNVTPGIEGIEQATGLNMAAIVLEHIRRDYEEDDL